MIENAWLEQHARGFYELQEDERLAIFHFVLLWSLFEARVLNRRGSACKIIEAAKRWTGDGLLKKEVFCPQINYFRSRYYVHGEYTCYFENLHLPQNYSRELVKEVLRNVDANPERIASAVLIIVYRIRNNLFHGEKWSYDLRGQLDNFYHANRALMNAIRLDDKMAKK